MPLAARREYQVPDFWTIFGHSFMQYSFGTYFQTGRADSILRSSLDIEHTNWQNYAVNGARAATEGASTGGFERFLRRVNRPQRGGPYTADGGTLLLSYGINDMGLTGTTTQIRTGFIHAMRTMISRWRASVIYENGFQVGTRTTYGAGFSNVAVTYASGGAVHWATSTTNANFTLTLPADYNGEPVSICLVGAGGTTGGTVTWSGTAGVTGTTSTSDIMPSAAVTHCPVMKRITTLTSANAGQTIIGTVTALDGGGAVMLDCWWLEAKEPPPVIVCNIARLTAAGYTGNYAGWSGTEASRDGDVGTWNADLRTLVAEFDAMVQIADVDTALAKTYYFTDGLHPDERGASRIADAVREAMRRLTPPGNSIAASLNPSAPRVGGVLRPRRNGDWHTAEHRLALATSYAPVVGHLYAIPMWVTQGRERWTRLAMQVGTIGSVNSTIRWGLYDDVGWSGYPQELVNEATSGGAFTVTFATGVKNNPTSGTGSINWVLDPGLYWLALLVVTAGDAAQRWAVLQGHNNLMPSLTTAGAVITSAGGELNGYRLTGQATGALPTTFPTGATAVASAVYIGVQVSINALNA